MSLADFQILANVPVVSIPGPSVSLILKVSNIFVHISQVSHSSKDGFLEFHEVSATVVFSMGLVVEVLGCQGCMEQKQDDLEWKGVDNKVEEQPWPQLVHCASICCRMCGCVFQEDRICCQEIRRGVVYKLIEVEIDIKDVNDFNL